MKICSFFIFLIGTMHTFASGLSATTNGVYLAIEGWDVQAGAMTNEPFPADMRLMFTTFCDTGQVELAYLSDPAYGIKIKMIDADGNEISKTAIGKKFGSKFEELHDYKQVQTGIIIAEGSYSQNQGQGMAKPLPSPQSLFDIKKPGLYTMEVEMQMFRVIKDTNQWQRVLFRFSPIKVKILENN